MTVALIIIVVPKSQDAFDHDKGQKPATSGTPLAVMVLGPERRLETKSVDSP